MTTEAWPPNKALQGVAADELVGHAKRSLLASETRGTRSSLVLGRTFSTYLVSPRPETLGGLHDVHDGLPRGSGTVANARLGRGDPDVLRPEPSPDELRVTCQLRVANVVYAGSHEGCGCA